MSTDEQDHHPGEPQMSGDPLEMAPHYYGVEIPKLG